MELMPRASRATAAVPLMLLAFAGPTSVDARPDLTVAGVAAPGYGHPAGQMLVPALAKTNAAAAASTVRLYLSKDRIRGTGDLRLAGKAPVPAVTAARTLDAATLATIRRETAPGPYYVIGCADDLEVVAESNEKNNCSASAGKLTVTKQAITTESLVQAAVARREITVEQGLLYRVYGAFGDSRIPQRFRGDYGGMAEDALLREVAKSWPALSATAKKAVSPFFVPPAARGSWLALPTSAARPAERVTRSPAAANDDPDDPCDTSQLIGSGWHNLPAAGGKIRIWWNNDPSTPWNQQSALFLARQIGPVYDRFKALMGREPLSDASSPCFHGPDGALDIYLIRWVAKAVALTSPAAANKLIPVDCTNTSAFIVHRTIGGAAHISGIAHELFHAFQMAFPYKDGNCKEYEWFDEGAASWAAHYGLHPDDPGGGGRDPRLLEDPKTIAEPLDHLDYQSWYFHLYVEKMLGAGRIPAMYHAFAAQKSLPAINSVLGGGFKRRWPEFTLKAWNRDPVRPSFRHWETAGGWGSGHPMADFWNSVEMTPTRLAIGGLAQRTLQLPANVSYLARKYFMAAVVDRNIRYLRFRNTMAGNPNASIQAIVTFADGHDEIRTWTGRRSVEFCRDKASENVTDLVIMYANTDWQAKSTLAPATQPTLRIRKECIPLHYRILKASLSTTAVGHAEPDSCSAFGNPPISSKEVRHSYSNPLLPMQPASLPSELETRFVQGKRYVSGRIVATLDQIQDDAQGPDPSKSVASCKFTATGIQPCSYTAPKETRRTTVAFAVDFQPWTASLRGTWSVPDPEIGIASGSYPTECLFPYIYFTFPPAEAARSEALFKFTGTGQQTITFSGTRQFERIEFNSLKTTLDYTWSMSITFVRIDEDGDDL